MKKSILFVIDSLYCSGAEKSLVTLLNAIDYSLYEIDLQLFAYGGELEECVPKEVNFLEPIKFTKFTQLSLFNSLKMCSSIKNIKMLIGRINYSYHIRIKKYPLNQKANIYWKCVNKNIDINQKRYDVAISYSQGFPTFYVADKIISNKKYAWVNAYYKLEGRNKLFQKKFYDKYDNIVCVSDYTQNAFLEGFREYKGKVKVVHDITDINYVKKMASKKEILKENYKSINLLTIGRIEERKGYDIAVDACEKLKEIGVDFIWLCIGRGEQEDDIKKLIKEKKVEKYFKLIGTKTNPYPYINACDIYVQTSRTEGFGLAIAEARMLNKPVVTTEFDAVYTQMVQEKNGLVVDMNGQAVCDGILRLIEDNELRNSIIEYLKQEKKGNTEEIEKFYELIEGE